MALNDVELQKNCEDELDILKGVIDYTDRMVYEDKHLNVLGGLADPRGYYPSSQVHLYKLLRKNAYAKTVVIETEHQGVVQFRLSPTEATYPNMASGYCTPHSNVGRLLTICHPGYEGQSKLWGEYRVIEVRSFDRFGGPEFEPNVRNFLNMALEGDDGKSAVHDLIDFRDRKRGVRVKKSDFATDLVPSILPTEAKSSPFPAQPIETPQTEVPMATYVVVDEPDELNAELEIDGDDNWDPDEPPVKLEEYYGLSERFFTHQTLDQNQIIARSPTGAMFVEGIAGSGKTSAALGRTKMLTTFNTANVSDEQQFHDIAGADQAYWKAEFAGQFSQESCIGFVRTGELIQYLQETCRRIDLPDLPVQEYKELQTKLREHRKLTSSSVIGRRWSGLAQPREAHDATTMKWLHLADQAVSKEIAQCLIKTLPTATELSEAFEPEERGRVQRVSKVALQQLQHELQEVANELTLKPRDGVFALDRLAVRLLSKLDEVRKRVMGPKIIWTYVAGEQLFANDENALSHKLVKMNAALYLKSGRRLVFMNEHGILDENLQLLDQSGKPVEWTTDTRKLMIDGKVIVRELAGKNVFGMPSDVNHLFLCLLPETSERIYVPVGGELRRMPREIGLGRLRLSLIPTEINKSDEDLEDENGELESEPITQGQPRTRTPDAEFARTARLRMLKPLASIADLYFTSLSRSADLFADKKLTNALHNQLKNFKLADEDIDLLLCLSHLIGRSLKQGGLSQLQERPFYQAVFVDEVQDFTEQQVYLMVEQANPKYRAITVVGDTAQKLHHGSSIDLRACFPGQSLSAIRLSENLRQAEMPGLALFSGCFRSVLQHDEPPNAKLTAKAHAQGDQLVRPKFSVCESDEALDTRIIETLVQARRNHTVAVLFPDTDTAEKVYKRVEKRLREQLIDSELSERMNLARRHIRHFADVAKSKGLEFDIVILVGVNNYDLKNASQVNRLYVGITRARKSLVLLTSRKQLAPELVKVREMYQNLVGQP